MALIPTRTNPANPYLQQPPRYSREDEKLAALLKANKNATGILNALRGALQWNRPLSLENPVHDVQPGDQVYVKNWSTDPLRESWSGPHQVILTTYTAVKVAGMDSWIHYTQVKKAPTQWVSQAVTPTRLILRANYS
ncbi:hypothetical protein DV515_00019111 [Chloebia gouldiae]|uniref:Murine leukemia virus integrase C-terminal domain-containing protein n=1 Tax=Chloebia gouldiae TaxID=44316 RepID=A0A3L8Q5N0_CHLGU|nr:hypothetical protein DV515_00019111 [Chloebia gouldiae]